MQDVSQKVEPYRELSIGVKEVRQIKLTGDYKYLVVLSADKVCVLPKGELEVHVGQTGFNNLEGMSY